MLLRGGIFAPMGRMRAPLPLASGAASGYDVATKSHPSEAIVSETDSFIEEVTEEVRRDKLFAFFRKYGWIAILAVVLIVGGAAYNEWRKARETAAAQAFGDAIMQALEAKTPEARAAALARVSPGRPEGKVVRDLLVAGAKVDGGDTKGALEILDAIGADATQPDIYRQLATFKAVVLRGKSMDKKERLAVLDELAKAGNPFRVAALEQKALAYYEYGNNDKAITVLRTILEEPDATQGLLQRAQQLIVALGGTLDPATGG